MPPLSNAEKIAILIFAIPLIFFALVALGRRLKRRDGVRLGLMYKLFCAALAVYIPASLFDPDFILRRELGTAAALLAAIFIITLTRRYLWEIHFQERRQTKIPKLLIDVVALLIFAVTLILVVRVGYKLPLPPGLLTGSGIVAVILGLAMQDLLSNIIAGLALHFGKPFQAGDWLIVENRHAEVMEVNWRSTRLRTNDHVYLDIPNREIARQTIVNLHYPTKQHAMRLSVGIDYDTPPNRVKDVIIHAVGNAKGVLGEPRPKVFLKNFGDHAVEYEVMFWMEDHVHYNDIADAVRSNIWYSFQRHGIKIPFPIRTLQIERAPLARQQATRTAARDMLRQQVLFRCLDEAQLDALLARAHLARFGRGEKLIQQSEDGDSMYILVRGEANVVVNRNGELTRVALLRSGDCFGEMSLLTGEKRSATVIAQMDCEVVEIDKPIMADVLKEKPDLLAKLSELLAKRQLETEGILAGSAQKQTAIAKQREYATTFLNRLRRFFEL